MHRIDCPTATPDNRFTEGDPTIPVAATTVTADWLNAVQEELAAVILGAGMSLDKESNTQVRDALLALITRRGPFVTCSTPAATAVKNLIVDNFSPVPGAKVYLRFGEVNTAENPQISINGGEGTPLRHQGMPVEVGNLAKGQVYEVIYTGEDWQILAGMSPWNICQTVWFEDSLERPGMIPLNGCTVPNFAAKWPQAFAYLNTAHGQARCFESLAEREAAHVAIWHTLASGATVGWEGFGGVCKFFYDEEADTLYMPDLRGMFRAMAGDGVVAPSMGAVMGDRGRLINGSFRLGGANSVGAEIIQAVGAFASTGGAFYADSGVAVNRPTTADFKSSRVVPVGAANVPRSWGSLACAYFGQPSGA